MIVGLRAVFASSWCHGVILAAFALLLQRQGLARAPIEWDHAYFTYLGQAILRGEPIYANTFIGYPPLGPMISAATMEVARWFGAPSYLGPRYLAVGVAAASPALLALLVRRATGSAGSGILAGILLLGFRFLLFTTMSTLTPKVLVLVLTLVACLAAQARRWGGLGFASGLAASCWQPAALVPIALFAVVARDAKQNPKPALVAWGVGILVGILPAVAYLTATGSWWDFWQRAVVIPGAGDLLDSSPDPLHWLAVVWRQFSTERLLFPAAGAGLVWFLTTSRGGGFPGLLTRCLDPRLGGVPILTLAWIAFSTIEFGAAPDMIPLLPLVAFWVAWLCHRLLAGRALSNIVWVGLATAAALFAISNKPTFSWTLAMQEGVVREIVERTGPDGTLMSFSASEVYAIAERSSPNRFLRLTDAFVPFLHLVGLEGCRGVLQQTLERRPEVVVLTLWKRSSDCERRIAELLPEKGYATQTSRVGGRIWHIYWLPWWERMPSR